MHKNRMPGKTAIKVKGIANHIESIKDIINHYSFVINSEGCFYSVGNSLVPYKEFEQQIAVGLKPNNYMQNQTIDPRHVK